MDTAWARLTIGGPVNKKLLRKILHKHDVQLAEDTEDDDAAESIGWYLEEDDDGCLTMTDEEKAWGHWNELERALVEAGIAFDRATEQGTSGTYDHTVYFRPGMNGPVEYAGSEGDDMVPLAPIRRQLDELGPEEFAGWFRRCHPVIPSLEPVRWITS